MKKSLVVLIAFTLTAIMSTSCVSVKDVLTSAISGAASGAVTSSASGATSTAGTGSSAVDFQPSDILASYNNATKMDSSYAVARILTAATSATKNQAEALFVYDGQKAWVNYTINSRKATKADMQVGSMMFYNNNLANNTETSVDNYRKATWYLGYITSTEELFKGFVEISGSNFYVDYLRVPTDPVK